jgi:hypothetical protein
MMNDDDDMMMSGLPAVCTSGKETPEELTGPAYIQGSASAPTSPAASAPAAHTAAQGTATSNDNSAEKPGPAAAEIEQAGAGAKGGAGTRALVALLAECALGHHIQPLVGQGHDTLAKVKP